MEIRDSAAATDLSNQINSSEGGDFDGVCRCGARSGAIIRLRLQVRVPKYTGTLSGQAISSTQHGVCWCVIFFIGWYRQSKSLIVNDFLLCRVLHLGCVTLFCHAILGSRATEPRWHFLYHLREAVFAGYQYMCCAALWALRVLYVFDLVGLTSHRQEEWDDGQRTKAPLEIRVRLSR